MTIGIGVGILFIICGAIALISPTRNESRVQARHSHR